MRVQRATLFSLLSIGSPSAGCSNSRSFEIPKLPDELALAALIEPESGRIAARAFIVDGATTLEGDFDGEYAVGAWVIARDELVGIDGRPFTDDELRGFVAGSGDVGCRRCPLSTVDPPQVMARGTTCGVPPFARSVGTMDSALLRSAVRIEWPGPCECEVQRITGVTPPISFEATGLEGWPISAVAVDDLGTASVLGQHLLVRETERGERTLREGVSLLPGAVLAAEGTSSGFVVAVHDPGEPDSHSRLIELEDGLEESGRSSSLRARPWAIEVSPSGSALIVGSRGARNPSVEVCADPFEATSCAAIDPFLPSIDYRFEDIHRGTHGALVVEGDAGGLLTLEGLPAGPVEVIDPIQTGTSAYGALRGADGSNVRWHFAAQGFGTAFREPVMAIRRDDAFACVQVEGGAQVLWASLSYEGWDWKALATRPRSQCHGVRATSTGASIVFSSGAGLACDRGGCDEIDLDEVAPGVDRPTNFETFPDGTELAWSGSEAFLRRPPRLDFARLYGELRRGARVTSVGDRVIEVGDGFVGTLDGESSTRLPEPQLAGSPIAVAADPQGREIVALYSGLGPCPRTVFRLSTDDLSVQPIAWPAELGCPKPTAVAGAGPGRFLVAADLRLFAVVDGEISEVEIEWDDPTTPEAESKPSRLCDTFLGAAAGQGGAIATGCAGLIARVNLYSVPPRAAIAHFPDAGRPPEFEAAALDCADSGAVGSEGSSSGDFEQGRVWRLFPSVGEATVGGGAIEIVEEPANNRAASSDRIKSERPIALVGPMHDLVLVFRDSAHRIGASGRFRWDGTSAESAARTSDGHVLVETDEGRVFIGF